jgi:carboxylesterase type B
MIHTLPQKTPQKAEHATNALLGRAIGKTDDMEPSALMTRCSPRPDWKQYNLTDRSTLVIDKKTTVADDALSNER